MTHWRRPMYRIETEYGSILMANEDEASAYATEMSRDPDPVKFRIVREPSGWADFAYIAGMTICACVVMGGLVYLFRG